MKFTRLKELAQRWKDQEGLAGSDLDELVDGILALPEDSDFNWTLVNADLAQCTFGPLPISLEVWKSDEGDGWFASIDLDIGKDSQSLYLPGNPYKTRIEAQRAVETKFCLWCLRFVSLFREFTGT